MLVQLLCCSGSSLLPGRCSHSCGTCPRNARAAACWWRSTQPAVHTNCTRESFTRCFMLFAHKDPHCATAQVSLRARGRHDPCVVPRAVPMVESMVALVLADQLLQVGAAGPGAGAVLCAYLMHLQGPAGVWQGSWNAAWSCAMHVASTQHTASNAKASACLAILSALVSCTVLAALHCTALPGICTTVADVPPCPCPRSTTPSVRSCPGRALWTPG